MAVPLVKPATNHPNSVLSVVLGLPTAISSQFVIDQQAGSGHLSGTLMGRFSGAYYYTHFHFHERFDTALRRLYSSYLYSEKTC